MKEAELQRKIRDYLRARGWIVYVTTCGAYMKGLPDLLCFRADVGVRLADVKRPSGSSLTKAQVQVWTDFENAGLGVWILVEPDEGPLLGPPNWREWWKPRYSKWIVRSGADILRELCDE